MADISKITALDGTTYDLKDLVARGKIVALTEDEYDDLSQSAKMADVIYVITDD